MQFVRLSGRRAAAELVVRRDFARLGDYTTCEYLDKADRYLSAWKFEKGWYWLERALEERQRRESTETADVGAARYFGSCVAALA